MSMSEKEKEKLLQQVETALDDIRPHLKVDGGNVEVIELTEDLVVKLKWMGACESCSMSAMTMKAGIEETIKRQVPEINGIVAVNGVGTI